MQDIPVFTTENGVASIGLREIPYKETAYITLRDSRLPEALLRDCVGFCRATGAMKIYAKGHEILEQYPLHTAIWQMGRLREGLPESDAALFPLTEETASLWRSLYNEKMLPVPNGATMTRTDIAALVKRGAGYFVHRGDTLLGIGIAAGDTIESLISAIPGAGQEVLLTLCGVLTGERVMLEVASANFPAVRLYQRLGFLKTAELSRWYDVGKII